MAGGGGSDRRREPLPIEPSLPRHFDEKTHRIPPSGIRQHEPFERAERESGCHGTRPLGVEGTAVKPKKGGENGDFTPVSAEYT